MKNLRYVLAGLVLMASLPMIYISCDGGGGGGGSSSGTSAAEPATITEASVDKTMTFLDETIPFCSLEASAGAMTETLYSLVAIGQDISDQTKLARISKGNATAAPTAEEDESVLNGDCGGTLAINMVEDEAAGTISGSIDIDNYCTSLDGETETLMNGAATISGSIQTVAGGDDKIVLRLNTSEPITITQGTDTFSVSVSNAALTLTQGTDSTSMAFTLSEAVVTDGDDSYTLGNVSISLAMTEGDLEDQITVTISSMVLTEETAGGSVSHQLQNVSLVLTSGATESTMMVSGTYINSDEGAVTLSTLEPITVTDQGEVTSGQLVAYGADGTRVSVKPSEGNLFSIQADTNGDGSYDYQAGTMDCSAFDADSLF